MASKTNSGIVIVEEAVCKCGEPIYKDLGGYWHHFLADLTFCPKYTATPADAARQQSQLVIEPQLDVETIARYIESDSECLMEIVVGETKKDYGVRLLKTLADEIRAQFRKARKDLGE